MGEGEGKHRAIHNVTVLTFRLFALITRLMIRGYIGGINTQNNVTGQVISTRDWAVTLVRRNDPGLLLIFGDVAITAASIAFRFVLFSP